MLLQGKKAAVFGIANTRSMAYGIAKAFREQGADLALSYMGDAIKKRLAPICDELGGEFMFPCDVTSDEQISDAAKLFAEKWGKVDVLVHSVAFASKDDLRVRFIDTSREGFLTAMNISVYSLIALARAFEPMLAPGASVLCMTYYGSQKVIPNYNVMGAAKAALESSVRYLASDLGPKGVRVNAISAGPVKTLSASAISEFSSILDHIEQRSPLRRNITIDDVGGTAVFLASDLASAVTGECIYTDSGFRSVGF
ncbi:MAG: enoyl-ACP reductase [Mailhella sp.]|nr:enoyl-ACP reductase [Mailhella sp.]